MALTPEEAAELAQLREDNGTLQAAVDAATARQATLQASWDFMQQQRDAQRDMRVTLEGVRDTLQAQRAQLEALRDRLLAVETDHKAIITGGGSNATKLAAIRDRWLAFDAGN